MLKRIPFIIIIAVLISSSVTLTAVRMASAQDPTIPTRTPTPDPNRPPPSQPSPTPSGSGGGGNNQPPATSTSSPEQPVNPPPAVASPQVPGTNLTPVPTTQAGQSGQITGQGLPGGDACDETPTIQTLSRITVHAGPGLDYPVVTTLEKDERRPIIGRAGYATWWQIQVRPRLVGWVLDEEVDELGNTALVPVVEPPMLNGIVPTPGAPWDPTPIPFVACQPTALPSATPPPTMTAAAEPTIAIAAADSDSGSGDSPQSSASSAMVEENQDQAGDSGPSEQPGAADLAAAGVSERGLTANRNEGSTDTESSLNLILPLGGIFLIAAGILVALLTRNRGGNPPAESPPAKS